MEYLLIPFNRMLAITFIELKKREVSHAEIMAVFEKKRDELSKEGVCLGLTGIMNRRVLDEIFEPCGEDRFFLSYEVESYTDPRLLYYDLL